TGEASQIPATVTDELTMSYAGAQSVVAAYPQYADQITAAAKAAFLAGDTYAYIAGIVSVLIGAALVLFFFPKKEKEHAMLLQYHEQDMAAMAARGGAPAAQPGAIGIAKDKPTQ